MSKSYEFSYQSPKQKVLLIGLKLLVAVMIGFNLYGLAWQSPNAELGQKLSDIGGICIGFWIYSNLCRVKIEVQELFVEPVDIRHMQEAMWVAAMFFTSKTLLTILHILRLHGIYF